MNTKPATVIRIFIALVIALSTTIVRDAQDPQIGSAYSVGVFWDKSSVGFDFISVARYHEIVDAHFSAQSKGEKIPNDPYYGLFSSGHNYMLLRAIDYLKLTGAESSRWPLDDYLPYLIIGSYYADNTELHCDWGLYEGGCDTIHHYGLKGELQMQIQRIPWIKRPIPPLSGTFVTTAHTGDFAAPEYAGALFEQAIKFWPGGDQPLLMDLPRRDGGRIQAASLGSAQLGPTYLGGLPFCDTWAMDTATHHYLGENLKSGVYAGDPMVMLPAAVLDAQQKAHNDLLQHPNNCPKWPTFAAKRHDALAEWLDYREAEETRITALLYLGWAIHLLQDITVPRNAVNIGDDVSEDFEEHIEKDIRYSLTEDVGYQRLPLLPNQTWPDGSAAFLPPAHDSMEGLVTFTRDQVIRLYELDKSLALTMGSLVRLSPWKIWAVS